MHSPQIRYFFFFNDTATTEIYTLSLHDALPILRGGEERSQRKSYDTFTPLGPWVTTADEVPDPDDLAIRLWLKDRKSTRLNSSHSQISYAVFCLKKKKNRYTKSLQP